MQNFKKMCLPESYCSSNSNKMSDTRKETPLGARNGGGGRGTGEGQGERETPARRPPQSGSACAACTGLAESGPGHGARSAQQMRPPSLHEKGSEAPSAHGRGCDKAPNATTRQAQDRDSKEDTKTAGAPL